MVHSWDRNNLRYLEACVHWRHLLAIMLATMTYECTCLGHLGRPFRIISIFVASPKVAKASIVMCHCCWHYRTELCQCKCSLMSNLVVFEVNPNLKLTLVQLIGIAKFLKIKKNTL